MSMKDEASHSFEAEKLHTPLKQRSFTCLWCVLMPHYATSLRSPYVDKKTHVSQCLIGKSVALPLSANSSCGYFSSILCLSPPPSPNVSQTGRRCNPQCNTTVQIHNFAAKPSNPSTFRPQQVQSLNTHSHHKFRASKLSDRSLSFSNLLRSPMNLIFCFKIFKISAVQVSN